MNFNFLIINSPEKAPLPELDRIQYITGPYSGSGISEVKTYLETEQARLQQKITVYTDRTNSNISLPLETYENKNIEFVMVEVIPEKEYAVLKEAGDGLPSYLVAIEPANTKIVQMYKNNYLNINFVPNLSVFKPDNLLYWQVYIDYQRRK